MTEPETHGLFGRLALAVMAHPRAWIAGVVVVTLLAIVGATRLRVDPNLIKLLPPDDPTAQAILTLEAEEGGANLLTVAVAGDDPAQLDAFMHQLVDDFEALPDVDYVLYDLDPDLAWRIGTLSLPPEDLRHLRDRLKSSLALGPAAANPFLQSRLLDLGPLTEKLKAGQDAMPLASGDGIARMIVRPTGSSNDVPFARAFMDQTYDLLDAADAPANGCEVAWVGGAYRHAVEDVDGIVDDLRWTVGASLVLVLGLVAVAFRDPRAIALIFAPLLVGNVWTLGFAGMTVQTLNTFTSFFTAVLIGLGVDFAIHLYARYREERARGGEVEEAVARAWDRTGPPCVTAALTSGGGFAALWVADFRGFQQLGTLLAGGVVLCLSAVLIVLPLLIQWREGHAKAVPAARKVLPSEGVVPAYRFAPVGMLAVLAVAVAAALTLPSVQFEYDISKLRTEGLAFDDLDAREQSLAQDSFAPIIVRYDTAEALAQDDARLRAAMAAGELDVVGHLLDIQAVIPTDQDARVELLREIAALARDPNLSYLPRQVQDNLRRIADSQPAPLTRDDLPDGLRHVLGARNDQHRMLIIPTGNMWDLREALALEETLNEWLPDRPLAGQYLAMASIFQMVKRDGPRVGGLALGLVFLLALIDLKSLGKAAGTVAALTVGLLVAGAGMAVFGIKLSMVNFVGIPILMGIGVDVIIHLVHRLDEEGPGQVRFSLTTTGWAAGLSAMTTIMSFAALTLGSNLGVRSLGTLIVAGLALVTLTGFVAVPLGSITSWLVSGRVRAARRAQRAANK